MGNLLLEMSFLDINQNLSVKMGGYFLFCSIIVIKQGMLVSYCYNK